jgi:hypothetical protein
MKYIKLKVQNNKLEFMKELLSHFDFVDIEIAESFDEPRIYPGANFEIRSTKTTDETNRSKSSGPSPEDMDKLRAVINRIDAQRDQARKS